MTPLYASIDIGTNSALLLVAEARGGVLEPVLQKVEVPRVGRNLSATGLISSQSFRDLMQALKGFRAAIEGANALLTGAVATQAFRKARNGAVLLAEIGAELGMPCRLLSGEEEARMAYAAVENRHPLPNLRVLDIGGGSTEVTSADRAVSLELGAVSLTESGNAPAEWRAGAQAALRGLRAEPGEVVAVGGTASALAMLELRLPAFDARAIEGLKLKRGRVSAAIDRLAAMPEAERAALPGLDPGRAGILVPGLCILEAFLEAAGVGEFRVSDRGLRYGVILEWLDKNGKLQSAN